MNEQQEYVVNRVQENTRLGLAKRMAERENAIITKLVIAYRANKLDPNMLYGGIAAISELRSIVVESEQDYHRAARVVENLTGNPNA